VQSLRRPDVALLAAAAMILATVTHLAAAEIERLGPCQADSHEGLVCGTGDGAARVLAGTTSPSQRLALAWRTPGGPPTEEPDTDDLELLLIRLSDGAILSKQKGEVWDTGESHSNRRDEKAAWSRDSRLMVETFDTRFSTDGVTVYAIGADDTTRTLDLIKIMEPAVRAQLKRRIKSDEGYVFFVQRIAIDNRGRIRALVHLWVPKNGPFAAFLVTAAVTRKGDALSARITAIRRSRQTL
jgi:hypothetical protein